MRRMPKEFDYIIWKETTDKYGVYLLNEHVTVYVNKEIVKILWQEEKELAEEESAINLSSLKTYQTRITAAIKHPLSLDYMLSKYNGKTTPYWLVSNEDLERDYVFKETFHEMLDMLPAHQRIIVIQQIENHDSIREAAKHNNMSKSTMERFLKKVKELVTRFFLDIF